MQINFFSMEGCGHCKRAEAELAEEISGGLVVKRPSSEAPKGVTGFPTFTLGDKMAVGYASKAVLFEKLGVQSENFEAKKHSHSSNEHMHGGSTGHMHHGDSYHSVQAKRNVTGYRCFGDLM